MQAFTSRRSSGCQGAIKRSPHHLMLDGAPGFNEKRGVPNGCIIRPVPDLLTDALHRRKQFASDAHALQHCRINLHALCQWPLLKVHCRLRSFTN